MSLSSNGYVIDTKRALLRSVYLLDFHTYDCILLRARKQMLFTKCSKKSFTSGGDLMLKFLFWLLHVIHLQ